MPLAARKHGNEKVRVSLDFGGGGGGGGNATLRDKPVTILPEIGLTHPDYCKTLQVNIILLDSLLGDNCKEHEVQ